jgi:hypothetical protein
MTEKLVRDTDVLGWANRQAKPAWGTNTAN